MLECVDNTEVDVGLVLSIEGEDIVELDTMVMHYVPTKAVKYICFKDGAL